MIRRTLALAGAAALAVGFTGLAGPAAADSGVDSVEVGEIVLNEVGVELDGSLAANGVEGAFIEIRNTTSVQQDVGGLELNGCNTTTEFDIRTFPSTTTIPANGTLLIAADDFSGSLPDFQFETNDIFELAGGGVELLNVNGTPMQDVKWGDLDPQSVCDAFQPADENPTAVESINYGVPSDAWLRDAPTP